MDTTEPAIATVELDPVARAIIEALEDDGRQSYAAIAKRVGMSEAAVRQRIQRLRDAGIIHINAVVDPAVLGLTCHALLGIRVNGSSTEVVKALQAIPQTTSIRMTTGSFDLMVELLCHSDTEAIRVVSTAVREIPGVEHTETFFYWTAFTRPSTLAADPAHS